MKKGGQEPGHPVLLQSLHSSFGPLHMLPPVVGSGHVQTRVRFMIPCPQDREQVLHDVQAHHSPSAEITIEWSKSHVSFQFPCLL